MTIERTQRTNSRAAVTAIVVPTKTSPVVAKHHHAASVIDTGFDALPGKMKAVTPIVNASIHQLQAKQQKPLVQLEALFSPAPTKRGEPLAMAAVAGMVVKATTLELAGRVTKTDPSVLQSVYVSFGRLDRAQFDLLHAAFGSRSEVKHDAARNYEAADFLPPALQALLHQNLAVTAMTLKGSKAALADSVFPPEEDLTLTVTNNCHAAAYEAAASFQSDKRSVDVFYGDATSMGQSFGTDVVVSSHVKEVDKIDIASMRPGDIIQYSHGDTVLLHSATYVGGGLFFEKPNTEAEQEGYVEETPYRLATLAMITKPVVAYCGDNVNIVITRPGTLGPVPSSDTQKPLEEWAKAKGRSLGVRLVDLVEVSYTGATVGFSVEPVVSRTIVIDNDGRGSLG
jgi:hypothetical protein